MIEKIVPAILERHFLVLRRQGSWCAKSLGRFGATYSTQEKALQATIERASKISKTGRDATVALFVSGGAPHVIWTRAH